MTAEQRQELSDMSVAGLIRHRIAQHAARINPHRQSAGADVEPVSADQEQQAAELAPSLLIPFAVYRATLPTIDAVISVTDTALDVIVAADRRAAANTAPTTSCLPRRRIARTTSGAARRTPTARRGRRSAR